MTRSTPLPDRIKAVRVTRFGPPDVISLDTIPCPVPGPGEVVVRIGAAGVGPWDAWIRAGKSALPQTLPLTLGSDLSGIVAACSPDVTDFRPGDAVFGVTNAAFTGSQAEYAVAHAGMIAPKPVTLSDVDAAALPVVAVTAWQALFEEARLTHGQTVLIHGAAGSVGACAVQLARAAGVAIVATASARNRSYVRCLGAQTVIDYATARFEDEISAVDAVIDLVGGETQTRSFAVLKPGGAMVSAVSPPDERLAAQHQVRAGFFLVQVTTERLQRMSTLVRQGVLRTDVGAVLPLAAARTVHAMLEGVCPRPRGKIVLRVADPV